MRFLLVVAVASFRLFAELLLGEVEDGSVREVIGVVPASET